jgi:putative transposase
MAPSLIGCIKCNYKELWKAGFYRNHQVYRCKSCKAEFTELSLSKYLRRRFKKQIILFSIMLYRHGLSSYAISEVLNKQFKLKVSAWTICKWARKFGDIRHLARHLSIRFHNVWHMDEMFIKANGRKNYLYAVIDDQSNVIAIHVSEKRDRQSAMLCLRKARWIAGIPDILVTDGWQAYPRVIRKVFGRGKVKHVTAHFEKKQVYLNGAIYVLSNNRIEGWNSWFRRIYKGMRGFKSIISMQRFLDIFWVLWNLKSDAWDFLDRL